jgi:hypothetical protein
MPEKRRKALIIHAVGIFILMLIWLLLFVFKNALGNLKYPIFILMVILTIAGIYFLSKILLKGLKD